MPNYRIPLAERFWRKVDRRRDDECWLWRGSVNGNGYGNIRSGGTEGPMIPAHRVAYEALLGPIPESLTIDHLCRNTLCVNPAHMEAVTSRENTLRSDNPAARNARKTHCKKGHALSGDNLRITGGRRVCRTCRRAAGARHDAKRRGVIVPVTEATEAQPECAPILAETPESVSA